jgi:hypothetical protein
MFYLLENQPGAGRPQAGAAYFVQPRTAGPSSLLFARAFFADFFQPWQGTEVKSPIHRL